MTASQLDSASNNVIIGNTVLYGATAGQPVRRRPGGRALLRCATPAPTAVVEGCGSNGCEYMTGGVAVILGEVGENFAAGMTGGMAFVYDPEDLLPGRINPDSVLHLRIETEHWESVVKDLVAQHVKETQSRYAERLLVDWELEKAKFWQIVPREMVERLAHPVTRDTEAKKRA